MPELEYFDVAASWKQDGAKELGFFVKKANLEEVLKRSPWSQNRDGDEGVWFNVSKNNKGDNPRRPDYLMVTKLVVGGEAETGPGKPDDSDDLPW